MCTLYVRALHETGVVVRVAVLAAHIVQNLATLARLYTHTCNTPAVGINYHKFNEIFKLKSVLKMVHFEDY